MYLPDRLDGAEVLITVKAYPQPSERYEELVCTAGLLNGTKWIRIYPVSFRFLQDEYRYQFLTKGDLNSRIAKIEDWEIGALFWNCLKKYDGDEEKANQKVREKYFEEFINKKDLYFFMGTTLANHIKAPNPFIIIGVFYPPKVSQISLPFDE